ncbi:uncharacterized protein F5147DRAFT_314428 [Suillus discolor]|uniref:Uncharacterized protein n=1 Tax=Suillus discolor TaxID=1912936 RepID=A0A9P7F285_9AGAM|nr:uncharacterized protein F5147DRAFT_314428 [Suillus discolor]KAG2101314.1 hypothetical protein F5147DRAFT_314428 [Suillus discolor]
MLRKLTLVVGPPNKLEADCLLMALRVASFHVPVVTFRTDVLLSKVDANDIEPLLSVMEEVTVCGNSFQAGNLVIRESKASRSTALSLKQASPHMARFPITETGTRYPILNRVQHSLITLARTCTEEVHPAYIHDDGCGITALSQVQATLEWVCLTLQFF